MVAKISSNNEIPIISGDQCSYWDAPIKIGALLKFFPERKIKHFVHDADVVGVPTKEYREKMILENKEYGIAREGVNATWTSGLIFVPSPEQSMKKKELFTGIVSSTHDEILASLNGSAEFNEIIYSSGVNFRKTFLAKNYFGTMVNILEDWMEVIGTGEKKENFISCLSAFDYFAKRKKIFLKIAESWSSEKTAVYNHHAKLAGMVSISAKKGEVPFFFVHKEKGKLIRKRAYLNREREWLEYFRNKLVPLKVEDVVAVIPKALIMAIFFRTLGNIAVMRNGSRYLEQAALLAKELGIKQFPVIRVNVDWNGFSRPFIGWIYFSEGKDGLRKIIENSSFEIEE